MKKIHISQIDIDKYLDWFFKQKGTSFIEEKEKQEKCMCSIVESITNSSLYTEEQKINLIEKEKKHTELIINDFKSLKYWKAPTEHEKNYILNEIEHEYSWRMQNLLEKLERSALDNKLIIEDEISYHLHEVIESWGEVHRAVTIGYLTSDFIGLACYAGVIKFAKEAQRMIESEDCVLIEKPLIWAGKVSNLGYIMGLLAENGYIDAPRKRDGEINYNEYARQISNVFNFEGNNVGTLAKALNVDNNNMNNDSKDLFNIPHVKDIS
ncbi:hypothetical protein [Bacteroides timonensis]|uniref:hypothetical protein n=1 Tax=Bacteroides timonensis TaxID=1470345 RepID=UPI0004B5E580|nr:hypothetical protein [Bacteroides timonensis]